MGVNLLGEDFGDLNLILSRFESPTTAELEL